MKCAHCGAKSSTVYVWTLQACADKRRKRKPALCGPCDTELNRFMLAYFNVPKADEKMAAYSAE